MTTRRPLRTVAFVLAAGFAVVACGGSDAAEDGTAAASEATEQAADETAQADDDPAPNSTGDAPEILQFTSPLVGGGELDAAELSGKPTAFWFWSPT